MMKPFNTILARLAACALMIITISPQATRADALDDAIKAAEARPEAPLVARTTMIRRAPLVEVHLSPNGKLLAYVKRTGKIRQLWLHDLDTGRHRQLFASKMIEDLSWSTDSNYIFMGSGSGIAVATVARGASPALLINLDEDKEDYALGVDRHHAHAIYASVRAEDQKSHTLYRVLANGSKQKVYVSEKRTLDFLTDASGRTFFIKRVQGNQFEIIKLEGGVETRLVTCALHDPCAIAGYDPRSKRLIMKARLGDDLTALFSLDPEAGEHERLHRDPKGRHDLRGLVPIRRGLPLLASYQDDYVSAYGFTPEAQSVIVTAQEKLRSPALVYRPDATGARWLVIDGAPDLPYRRYFVLDQATGELSEPLAGVMTTLLAGTPLMPEAAVAPRVPVHYDVSDGMAQQGYVTLPLGKPLAHVPLVVMPHGGPWGRNGGSYDAQAQFLANRGYAVFQPNFRASTGFGRTYVTAANRDFGDGRVQQDIIDGMNYVLSRGVGDRARLAIVGHSFGGFSVLGALAFTPELFKAGFAGAPPADLTMTIKRYMKNANTEERWLRYQGFRELSVDLDDPSDVARLRAQSPNAQRARVIKPLYIWAGGRDPKVSILDVRDYARRQAANAKPVTLMVEPRAGHSPRDDLHIEAYQYMLEKALAKHIGGRLEAALSPKLERYIRRSLVLDSNDFLPVPK